MTRYKNAKIIFYFNQYFGIRLGEKVYSFTPSLENFAFFRALAALLNNYFKNLKSPLNTQVTKKYKYLVYLETLNQKNAIIDVFHKMEPKNRGETLFVLNNGLHAEGFESIYFNNRKLFFLGLCFLPKAVIISKKYAQANKGIVNKCHVYVNLALFMASVKMFETYIKTSGCDKIVVTNDHNIKPLGVLLASKNLNVKSYYIQHASVSEVFPKLLPDVALLEGMQAVDTYKKIGSLSRMQRLVGIARMDGLLAYKKEFKNNDITVGICLKPYYTKELLNELIGIINNAPTVKKIILRPHPGNSEKFYKFLESFNVEISNARKERPHEFIKKIDVMISGESSILLEATLMKVKTVYIDDGFAKYDLYGFVRNGVTTAVESIADIAGILDSLSYEEVEEQYRNCQYYCSTVNTADENKSKELILNYLLKE